MMLPNVQTALLNASANLDQLCDQVTNKREAVIIQREDAEDVVLISAAELRSLQETLHLFRSPRNTERLLAALARAKAQIEKQKAAQTR